MIKVTCQGCGLSIQVPPTVQGRTSLCFGCGAKIQVPDSLALLPQTSIAYNVGDRVADRYVIEAEVGKGGMGTVYKARDELVDEKVALKFMNPKALQTQQGQQLFIKEAQIARRLRHENIVAVHDVSTTPDGVLYLSMEFVNGLSLRQYLRKRREQRKLIEVRFSIALTLQILDALEYAHRTVVHRDLKPENVMLLPGERAKVLDFGLAVATEHEGEHPAQEGNKNVIGTVAYAAPEQKNHHAVDFRADLYTVGLILHELLTLRTPLDKHVTVPEARQDVAPSILNILDKALLEEKDRRWQSAVDFRVALREAYDDSYRDISVTEAKREGASTVSTEDMIYLEGGSFLFGNNDLPEEAPEFEVHVEPYYIDKYPVTIERYERFMEETDRAEPQFWHNPEFNGPRQPVVGVTWHDALAYAAWAGKQLPTERQWEFAARGKENRPYPWGNLAPDSVRCNFGDYLGMPSIVTMHDSGQTKEGVFDMGGNVFEWTLDGFEPYDPQNGGDNTGSKAPRRVVRGGSWHSQAHELRTASRKGLFPEAKITTVGLRCVVPGRNVRSKPGD